MYLIDTHWVISFLNGRRAAAELIGKLTDDGFSLSSITCGEVFEGLVGTDVIDQRAAEFEALINRVNVIAPDIAVARRYATIRAHLRARGMLLADNDLWIAATALALGLTLVSRDQHFARVPGLHLYEPEMGSR